MRSSRTSRSLVKPGTKLISITALDLSTKGNYQDFQRYPEVDVAMAADAEATLPALIEACKRLITAERRTRASGARQAARRGACARARARARRGGVRVGRRPDQHGAPVGRAVGADQERGLGARRRERHHERLDVAAMVVRQALSVARRIGRRGGGLRPRVGVVAVDGTKVHANASERATRDYEQIAREILEEAAEIDALEDEQLGERRGDELPPALSTREGRQRWLRDARRRLDQRRAEEARPIPRSRAKRLLEARRRLDEELAVERRANAEYEAYRARGVMKDGRRFGGPPKPYQPPETPAGKINLTDLDSRNVKTLRGWVQGYNAQAVCTEEQIVIAAEVTIASADFGQLEPMVTATETELTAAGVTDAPEVVLADAGYWHTEQIERLIGRGTVVLIPPDAGKRKGARPGWDGGIYAFMRRVLATDRGGELYRKRKA